MRATIQRKHGVNSKDICVLPRNVKDKLPKPN